MKTEKEVKTVILVALMMLSSGVLGYFLEIFPVFRPLVEFPLEILLKLAEVAK